MSTMKVNPGSLHSTHVHTMPTTPAKHILMLLAAPSLLLLLLVLVVAGARAGAGGNPEEGCISRTSLDPQCSEKCTALITSTLQDEMDMWVCSHGHDVIVNVRHSGGSCTLKIKYSDMREDEWLPVKLSLKDAIELTVSGTRIDTTCVGPRESNSMKTVSVDNGNNPFLPACRQGPAIYQISKHLADVLVPWYEEEARLLLEPENDTQIRIEVGSQELVVCFNGTHVAALHSASACTAGVGTFGTTLTIPKSNKFIKVTTADGQEVVTAINNGAADVPPTVKKTLINGTVIMRQCKPHCTSEKHDPGDCSHTGYVAGIVILAICLLAALTCLVFRDHIGAIWRRVTRTQVPATPLLEVGATTSNGPPLAFQCKQPV